MKEHKDELATSEVTTATPQTSEKTAPIILAAPETDDSIEQSSPSSSSSVKSQTEVDKSEKKDSEPPKTTEAEPSPLPPSTTSTSSATTTGPSTDETATSAAASSPSSSTLPPTVTSSSLASTLPAPTEGEKPQSPPLSLSNPDVTTTSASATNINTAPTETSSPSSSTAISPMKITTSDTFAKEESAEKKDEDDDAKVEASGEPSGDIEAPLLSADSPLSTSPDLSHKGKTTPGKGYLIAGIVLLCLGMAALITVAALGQAAIILFIAKAGISWGYFSAATIAAFISSIIFLTMACIISLKPSSTKTKKLNLKTEIAPRNIVEDEITRLEKSLEEAKAIEKEISLFGFFHSLNCRAWNFADEVNTWLRIALLSALKNGGTKQDKTIKIDTNLLATSDRKLSERNKVILRKMDGNSLGTAFGKKMRQFLTAQYNVTLNREQQYWEVSSVEQAEKILNHCRHSLFFSSGTTTWKNVEHEVQRYFGQTLDPGCIPPSKVTLK